MLLRAILGFSTALCTFAAVLILAATTPPAQRAASAPQIETPAVVVFQPSSSPTATPVAEEVRLLRRPAARSGERTAETATATSVPALPSPSATPLATPDSSPTPEPTVRPTPRPTQAPVARVTAVGDSVMKSAAPYLTGLLGSIDVDAVVGREVDTALAILQARSAAGRLGEVVLVQIGNNGPFSAYQFRLMMEAVGDRPVVFVTVKVPKSWEEPNNAMLASLVVRYPNATLVDWYGFGISRPALFYDDGVHLREAGARAYANLIAPAVAARLP